ncbi:hypothetical protein L7F22_056523 [Adiantum nelumboides]|nr:hypothetical protein [Adiantum nelumboides]
MLYIALYNLEALDSTYVAGQGVAARSKARQGKAGKHNVAVGRGAFLSTSYNQDHCLRCEVKGQRLAKVADLEALLSQAIIELEWVLKPCMAGRGVAVEQAKGTQQYEKVAMGASQLLRIAIPPSNGGRMSADMHAWADRPETILS